jgi:toxin CptA
MHNAPSVIYPVGRSRFAAAVLSILWLLGALATALGWLQAPAAAWRWGGAGALLAVLGLLAARSWWRQPSGLLAWDGEGWSWSVMGGQESGVPEVCLDLQQRILVRWVGGGTTRWLWLERAVRPAHWDDLRRAVYSRARSAVLPEAEQSAAKT